MPRARPPFLHREVSRHGKVVWVVRREHGSRVRLRAEYDSDLFWDEYRAALTGRARKKAGPKQNSLAWAIDKYRSSSAWARLAPATRKQRENIYKAVIATAGEESFAEIDQATIREGRERRAETPHSANNFLKAMRGLFAWAVEAKQVTIDPTAGVPLLHGKNEARGFHTWTEEEVARFEAHWPVGTRERLAFDLLLYTGLRRGDVVTLGRQHVRDGMISLRTEKTGEEVFIPVLAPLARSIGATKTGDLTFIVTDRGLPFVKESFGNWFGEVCRKTKCPGSAHGLRKAGATRAAENGATERQLMALYGWKDGKMAAHYTRSASKKKLAAEAAAKLISAHTENENALTQDQGEGVNPKIVPKSGA